MIIKSLKKLGFHYLFRRHIFPKKAQGLGQIDPPVVLMLKAVFPFSEELQCGLFGGIYCEYSWQLFQLLDKKWRYSSTLDTNSIGASTSSQWLKTFLFLDSLGSTFSKTYEN